MNNFFLLCAAFVIGAGAFFFGWRAWLGGLGIKFPNPAPWYMRRWLQMLCGAAAVYGMVAPFGNWMEAAALAVIAMALWSLEHAPGISMGRMLPKLSRDHWSGKVSYPIANVVSGVSPGSFLSFADMDMIPGAKARLQMWAGVYLSVNYGLRSLALVGAAVVIVRLEGGRLILSPWFAAAGLLAGPMYWAGWTLYDRGRGIIGDNPSDQGGMHNGEALNGAAWGMCLAAALLAANVA